MGLKEKFEMIEGLDMRQLYIQLEYMLRIMLAGTLGFFIGHERKNRNKSV